MIAYDQTAPADVAQRIRNAQIVITNKVPVSAQDVAQAGELKLVAVAATGTNIVDIEACRDKGIVVTNIRNYAVNTVPEHTLALIFALRRSLLPYHARSDRDAGRKAGSFAILIIRSVIWPTARLVYSVQVRSAARWPGALRHWA